MGHKEGTIAEEGVMCVIRKGLVRRGKQLILIGKNSTQLTAHIVGGNDRDRLMNAKTTDKNRKAILDVHGRKQPTVQKGRRAEGGRSRCVMRMAEMHINEVGAKRVCAVCCDGQN